MKKALLIPLTILAGGLVISLASNLNTSIEVKAEERTYYIPMNADAFIDYEANKGSFADADATFWGENYSFNALDPFFRGETEEGWTGTLSLKPWKQFTQYIRFQWGGAKNIENQIGLEFHYGDYSKTVYNDTFVENPMMMDYFKIPDEEFANLDQENGFDMYIKLIDNRTSDYGFHNFGSLYVNQNEEEVSNAMRYYLNHINLKDVREWKVNNDKAIYNFYLTNEHLKSVFLRTVNNVNEDFENNNAFVNHWYIDLNYDNYKDVDRHVDNAFSNRAVRDGSNMPFNGTGASFFSGWYEGTYNQGYIASDQPIYRFVSRPFVLGGTGLVSIKMAGRAASLHVIDAETQEDLAWADVRTFNASGDENRIFTGFNTVTMVRHYINLSKYLGKTIQLALADVYDDFWAASYFDELVTNYEIYPTFDIDVLFQDKDENKTYSYWFDQYIASTHIENDPSGLKYKVGNDDVDESPINAASKFLKHYYSALRSPANEFDYSKASVETRKAVYEEYAALDDDAKAIVDNSKDLKLYTPFDADWYKRAMSNSSKISDAIGALVEEFKTFTVSFSGNGGSGEMADVAIKGEYRLPTCTFTAPEGKEFAGWKVNGEGDLLEPGEVIDVTADTEIVAQWKDIQVIKYIVTFNSNGGSGTMNNMEVIQGEQLTLPACTFTAPEGKEFDCWIVKRTLYAVGDKVDIISDTEVFAQWKRIQSDEESYTISFSANGGTGEMADVTDVKGDYTLPQCGFTAQEGKEFKCWLIGNEEYQPGQVISVDENISVIASWKNKEVVPPTPGPEPSDDDSSSQPPSSSEEGDSSSEETPVEPTNNKGCSGEILLSTSSIALVSSLALLFVAIKKRKNHTNK